MDLPLTEPPSFVTSVNPDAPNVYLDNLQPDNATLSKQEVDSKEQTDADSKEQTDTELNVNNVEDSLLNEIDNQQQETATSSNIDCVPDNDIPMQQTEQPDIPIDQQNKTSNSDSAAASTTVEIVGEMTDVSMNEVNDSAEVSETQMSTNEKSTEPEVTDDMEESASFYTMPDDISRSADEGPTQPKLDAYPKTPIGGPESSRFRSFSSNWFKRFPWLEYSITNDRAYCFACRHYGNGLYRPSPSDPPDLKIPLRKGLTIYATIGFNRWTKAHERMQRHNSSARHLEAMGPWLEDTLNREKRNNAANGTEQSDKGQSEAFKELEKAAAVAIVNTKPLPSKRKRSRPTKKAVKHTVTEYDVALTCPSWCNCTKCADMSRMHECVCCCDVPEIRAKIAVLDPSLVCITEHPGFAAICLNEWAVQVAYYHHKQESGTPAVNEEHERFRYIAYCQFVRWCWGYLQEDMHIPLPSCVVNKIKATFHAKAKLPALDDLPSSSEALKE